MREREEEGTRRGWRALAISQPARAISALIRETKEELACEGHARERRTELNHTCVVDSRGRQSTHAHLAGMLCSSGNAADPIERWRVHAFRDEDHVALTYPSGENPNSNAQCAREW